MGNENAVMALDGKLMEEGAVTSVPSRCLDTYVDLSLVKELFTVDGWTKVEEIVDKKRKSIEYICPKCETLIDMNFDNVVCDSCLNVHHLSCVGLKNMPKIKHWYCKNCKSL